MEVLPAGPADRPRMAECCRRLVRSAVVVSPGVPHLAGRIPSPVAWEEGHRGGALGLGEDGEGAEMVLKAADRPGRDAGASLLAAGEVLRGRRGWGRLRRFGSDDNGAVLALCPRRGWDLAGLHRSAVARDRLLLRLIPAADCGSIPVRHSPQSERWPKPREEGGP